MLIFQPAEEGPPEDEGGGAKMMLQKVFLKNINLKLSLVCMLLIFLMEFC